MTPPEISCTETDIQTPRDSLTFSMNIVDVPVTAMVRCVSCQCFHTSSIVIQLWSRAGSDLRENLSDSRDYNILSHVKGYSGGQIVFAASFTEHVLWHFLLRRNGSLMAQFWRREVCEPWRGRSSWKYNEAKKMAWLLYPKDEFKKGLWINFVVHLAQFSGRGTPFSWSDSMNALYTT